MYLLRGLADAQDKLWTMLERRAFGVLPLDAADAPRMRELMAKYSDQPMDLADAALVRVRAERDRIDLHRRQKPESAPSAPKMSA